MGWESGTWVDSQGNAASALSFKEVRRRSALESSPALSPFLLPACMYLYVHLPCISKGGIFPRELPCTTPPLHLLSTPPASPPPISPSVEHVLPSFTPPLSPLCRQSHQETGEVKCHEETGAPPMAFTHEVPYASHEGKILIQPLAMTSRYSYRGINTLHAFTMAQGTSALAPDHV